MTERGEMSECPTCSLLTGVSHNSYANCIVGLQREIRALKAERDFLKTSWDEYECRAKKIIQEREKTIEGHETAMQEAAHVMRELLRQTKHDCSGGHRCRECEALARLEKP